MKNQIIQSLNIGGETTADHQTIADTFNRHFIMIPDIINKKILIRIIQSKHTEINNLILWQTHLILHFPV